MLRQTSRLPPKPRSAVRIPGDALADLSGQAKDQARKELREAIRLRKLLHPPWAAAKISSREAARNASDMVHGLSTGALDTALDELSETCAKLGIRQPYNCHSWAGLYHFLDQVAETCDLLGNEVFTLDLPSLVTATASRAERRDRSGPQPRGSVDGRCAVKQGIAGVRQGSDSESCTRLSPMPRKEPEHGQKPAIETLH